MDTRLEPRYIVAIKALLYVAAVWIYVYPVSTSAVAGVAGAAAVLAILLAPLAAARKLRLTTTVVLVPIIIATSAALAALLRDTPYAAQWLDVTLTLRLSDALMLGTTTFAVVFVLRLLARRYIAASLLELSFVCGALVTLFASHRNRALNRPRFFSDWAWSQGIDPSVVLMAIGVGAGIFAILLFLRRQRILKLAISLVFLLLVGGVFWATGARQIPQQQSSDPLGLSGGKSKGKNNNDKNKSGGGGGGNNSGNNSDNPFKDDYNNNSAPSPIGVAIFHDDFVSQQGVIYFRQRTLSQFNGHHLTPADAWDNDVIVELPSRGTKRSVSVQSGEHHLKVPTTMYLMVDHPQPPALTHATRIRPVTNPNPRQFVAAYEVISEVLSVPPQRLVGRRSVPQSWSKAQRDHYTALPDDPRYASLADTILRTIDPRYAHDDLGKALAIKHFLEKEGFYTRKTTYRGEDPTAEFLFGPLRGYCVHFAHAAVYLFRSAGIAARVALGYAVQTSKRNGGSAVLIMGDRAHAWPEIYLDGVGWVTFDVYPERTDMPPASPVDYDLEKLLGELARADKTGGIAPDGKPKPLPWRQIGHKAILGLLSLLAVAYAIKSYRRWIAPKLARRKRSQKSYRATLDRLSDVGLQRQYGETREAHAQRLASVTPSFAQLTALLLAERLGPSLTKQPGLQTAATHTLLMKQIIVELRSASPLWRRGLGAVHPLSWLKTR